MKKVRGDLYVHRNYIADLPNEDNELVNKLLNLIPSHLKWNIVCVRRDRKSVSFLYYPSFFEIPHPVLYNSIRVNATNQTVTVRHFHREKNPPILHRKETFLNPKDPYYTIFEKLTKDEEKYGLYSSSILTKIGRKMFWENLLREKGLSIQNHKIINNIDKRKNVQKKDEQTHVLVEGRQLSLFDNKPESKNAPSSQPTLARSSVTAIFRKKPSLPATIAVNESLIHGKVFDWGCGHGRDLIFFQEQGFDAEGWDPAHKTDTPPSSFPKGYFNWVQNNYVLNTISDPHLRVSIINEIFDFLPKNGQLYISVRPANEIQKEATTKNWQRYQDGWITGSGSFQKGFTVDELMQLLHSCGFKEVDIIRKNPVILFATKV